MGDRGGYDTSLNTPDSVNPEELATQGVRIKEEQLRREGENSFESENLRDRESARELTLLVPPANLFCRGKAPRARTPVSARVVREAPGTHGQGGAVAEPRGSLVGGATAGQRWHPAAALADRVRRRSPERRLAFGRRRRERVAVIPFARQDHDSRCRPASECSSLSLLVIFVRYPRSVTLDFPLLASSHLGSLRFHLMQFVPMSHKLVLEIRSL